METLQTTSHSLSDRQWAAGAHAAALVAALVTSWIAGVAGALGALAVWMLVRDRSSFAADHAKEAVNFNLSMFIYMCIAVVIGFLLVGVTVITLGIGALLTVPAGFLLLLAVCGLAVLWLVCSLIAVFKAYDGQTYRYPLTMRLFR
ncbi:MAG: DUF4870 domain-containing protein [Lysobacter sp.]|nr:DUF4870 domain-containing protein [Lysobacter sp.]